MMSFHHVAAAALSILASVGALADSAADVFATVANSVVTIEMRDELGMPSARASGVVLAKDEVVTNCHVVVEGESIMVRDAKGNRAATWVLRDPKHDLCLLRIDGLDAPAAELGSTKELKIGDPVYAVGNPLGMGLSITEGRLAAAPQPDRDILRLVTTAQVSPGSSGGGLFDTKGRLLGITTAIYGAGQGFSLTLAVEGVEALRKNGLPVTPPTRPVAETDWRVELDAARARLAWGDAEAIARRYLEIYPYSDFGWVRLGQALLNTGRASAAKPLFEKALQFNPNSMEARGLLAVCLSQVGERAAAEAAARQMVDRWPGSAYAHAALGDALMLQQRWPEASVKYQRAVELLPSADAYWATLGAMQMHQDKFEAALRSTKIALKLNPDNKTAKANLPLVLGKLGRWQDARTRMEDGAASDSSAETWARLGYAALADKRLTDAEQAFRKALSLDSKSESARTGLGSVLTVSGRFPEAANFLTESLAQYPQNAALLMLMSQVQAASGDIENAEKSVMLSLEKNPDDLNAWRLLYSVRDKRRDYRGMVSALEQVLRRSPKDGQQVTIRVADLLNLSRALLPLKEFDRAEKALQEAILLQPNSANAYVLIGSLKGRRGDAAAALEYADKALAIEPGLVPALSVKGFALFTQKRFAEAAPPLEIAARMAPDDSNVLINLGQVYMAQGQIGRAIAVLERAVNIAPTAEDARVYLMQSLFHARQLPQAQTAANKWLQDRPNSAGALYWSTLISLLSGDREHAVSTYRQLQVVDSNLAADVKRRSRAPDVSPQLNLPD